MTIFSSDNYNVNHPQLLEADGTSFRFGRAVFCGTLVVALAACGAIASPEGRTDDVSESSASLAAVTLPPVNGKFDYQIGGAYTPVASVQIVDRDRHDAPVSGKYNICYINALQTQPDDSGGTPPEGTTQWWIDNHPDLVLFKNGEPVMDEDWEEAILDVSTPTKRQAIFAIERTWIQACAQAGYQAIEPDNLDSYDRSQDGFELDADLEYMKLFVPYAHSLGLAVAQKNTTELESDGKTVIGFDFAIAEECQNEEECDSYTDVYGQHVIEIEYTDYAKSVYTDACTARGAAISIIRRDRDVVPAGASGYSYSDC